ncbi:hypothetical protein [Novosphingobium aquae]|uniref:PilZ domain-containing protein n=1 Tax=Novosphingobium aquae TaxID=3133435 RepID=A0ABU8S6N7_9SPHN
MLKDMPPLGARIEGMSDVRMGDAITLLLPCLEPKLSNVVWQDSSSAGVEFDHPLHGEVFKELVRDYAPSRPSFEPVPMPMPAAMPASRPMRAAA